MNMILSAKDRAALMTATEIALEDVTERVAAGRGRHAKPFSKTEEGKTRRNDRRNARAAKASFLNSRE